MNTRQKMYITNTIIRRELLKLGFNNLYFFPHLRFQKDYHLDHLSFDALGWKDKMLYLMQFKTNVKPTSKILEEYKTVGEKYGCRLIWVTKFKNQKGIQIYGIYS